MYPSQVGNKFLVQYAVSGTGHLNGQTEYGRARLTINPGPSDTTIFVAAKLYGDDANALTVQLIDTGAINPQTFVTQVGPAISVYLRRSSTAVLATAYEVAEAINSFTAYTSVAYAIRARAYDPTSATPLTAVAAANLSGGVNPHAIGRSQYLWTVPLNGKVGYVDFEQEDPMWVLGFSAKFSSVPSGSHTITVSRVRILEDFTPELTEKTPLFVYSSLTSSAPDIAYTDVRQVIHPAQGLLVETSVPMPGFFNVDVMRAAEFPYA